MGTSSRLGRSSLLFFPGCADDVSGEPELFDGCCICLDADFTKVSSRNSHRRGI
jgi:hypothetical protein